MVELDSSHRAVAALWDFTGREEVEDLEVRGGWRTGLVVAEALPSGFVSKVQLAGHDGVVSECGTFP